MNKTYQIKEYASFITGKEIAGGNYITLPESTFNQLEHFILTNRSKDTDALELMGISARKGIGKVITAKNYVGVITMRDGTTIEILPKIYLPEDGDQKSAETKTKKVLIEMLKTLRNFPYKSLQTSNINLEKMNILEVFIRMFIKEVFFITKRGLKCSYETVEDNTKFFKGKMKFSEQIKFNHTHKERNFLEYDMFSSNRPENKLLKSTLLLLYTQSISLKNKHDIKVLLNAFDNVEASNDYPGDFSKYVPERNMKDYGMALLWCMVFLSGKSFTSFSGAKTALALLFPMEMLFESYIAAQLKKNLRSAEYTISVQDKTHHLFDLPTKKFLMKPDIVVTRKSDQAIFILDTKWKVLVDNKMNYGISQTDVYQMYAYQKKYGAKSVTLLYPMTNKITSDTGIIFSSHDGIRVNIQFIDLFNVENSLANITKLFTGEDIE